MMSLPLYFSTVDSVRKDKKLGNVSRKTLLYKGEGIAIFEGEDLETRALEYVATYGYLAEWVYQKYVQGKYVNWSDDMFIDVNALPKWAGDYQLPSWIGRRKLIRYRGWVIKVVDTGEPGFPYEFTVVHPTIKPAHAKTSFISEASALMNARFCVDSYLAIRPAASSLTIKI